MSVILMGGRMKLKKNDRRKIFVSITSAGLCLLVSGAAYAQASSAGVSKPLVMLVALAALAMVPIFIMMVTSFVKVAVVLALIRNAMGTQQVPPNIIITGLAMILTIYIMVPVGYDVYRAAGETINQGTNQPLMSQASIGLLSKAAGEGKEPIRKFLLKHVHPNERALFYSLSLKLRTTEDDRTGITDQDFINLVPAFVVSELTEAFQIGFIIFLPFLVIDLVIANILLSLGMFQISPVTISLPFKLLLFVLVDGWHIISRGLILGYV